MTRQTSIEAFREIQANGLLSQRRFEVYSVVYHHGPMTSAEAFKILNDQSPVKNLTQSRARFTELREIGVFQEVGMRKCSVTGHKAIVWDVTDNIPVKMEKPIKMKCPHCDGKGFVKNTQRKLF